VLIDMHAHVIPDRLPPANGRAGWPAWDGTPGAGGRLVMGSGPGMAAASLYFDVDARLEHMASHGVDAEAISPLPTFLNYSLAPDVGLDLCRYVNEWLVELTQKQPKHFYGLGVVPLQDPELASKELAAIKRSGLFGVEIASNVNGASLGDPKFLPFFQEVERQGLAIFVHGLNPTFNERLGPGAGGSFGIAAEIALGATGLLSSGLLEKCPDIRIALSHGAGGFPLMLTRAQFFVTGSWNEGPRQPNALGGGYDLPRTPIEYARKFFYDSLVFDERAVRYLVDMIGPDQLMIGTDHPAMVREEPVGKTLRMLGLPPAELEAVTWNTAFRWLGAQVA
jgi:aminocarboxymuconate-semialdehyde decarboxylase